MADNRSNAALNLVVPQRAPQRQAPKAPAKPRMVPKKKKSPKQAAQEMLGAILRSAKITAVCVCLLIMMSMLIFERAQLMTLNSQKSKLEDQLQEVKSDTVRLESQFNSLVSVDSVEEYARSELGMIKRHKSDITFFANDGVDEIVIPDSVGN